MDFEIISHNIREVISALDKIVLYPGYNNAKTYSNIIEALNGIAVYADQRVKNKEEDS